MKNQMPKASIIIGTQLKKARELLKLSLEEVAQELKISLEDITNWEKQKTNPNLSQLEKLAYLYGREIDFFLKVTPEPPKNVEFRGKPGKSLRDLSKETKIILARFDEQCRTIYEFENLLNKKFEIKLPTFEASVSPIEAAYRLRKKVNLVDESIPKLRELLENEGTRIFEFSILNEEFSGFSYWHKDYGPCILLNSDETQGRRNFTLAHELAHLLFEHGSSVCYIPLEIYRRIGSIEYKANQFAVELLLPKSIIIDDFERRQFSSRPSRQDLSNMSYKWGVSIQALGYRLENLGFIERGHTNTLVEPKKPPFMRRPKIPKWERSLGKYYVETSIKTYKKNLITIGKLAHSWQLPISKTIEEVKRRT